MKKHTLLLILSIFTFLQLYSQKFTGSFDLVVSQQYDNGNQRGDTLSYFFGKDKTALIIHAKRNQPDLRLIFNVQDSTITGLFEHNGIKGGYILPMNDKYWPGMNVAMRDYGTGPRTKLNYTGKTKEIEGYQTREVLAVNGEYTASLWMPEAIELNMGSVLAYQSVGAGKDAKEIELFDQFGVEGLPLEMLLKSKTGRADVIIRVIHISKTVDENIFSSEGYSISKVDN
ncbi:hypothetical protein [Marixanthomonas ophiurae]|uniref:DUF4412 domain-containing protein n=1 Tax=Marixanthomonas ophiurae TaxID=387659 RepID=A0A3E1Q727_9FLAO|nr:hypothetical protein [Marixanthomonas ophiurae]RFN57929.1 hypothetical protein DZ858_11845 [Marixanthomonas ophiurae]